MQRILAQSPHDSNAPSCHGPAQASTRGLPLVTIVGSPNVGKSVLFNVLTGIYVTVSNYPGTTVEVTRGRSRLNGAETGVMDTPGMYGLMPITEEERVARNILLNEQPNVVLHVVDAKNIERMLPMTLQLIEAGLPVVLVVNLMDEAEQLGLHLDTAGLAEKLGIPVIATALAYGRGAGAVRAAVAGKLSQPAAGCSACAPGLLQPYRISYSEPLENALRQIESLLHGAYTLSRRGLALLLLQNDCEVAQLVRSREGECMSQISQLIEVAQGHFHQPLSFIIPQQQRAAATRLVQPLLIAPDKRRSNFAARLSDWLIHPLTGLPFLLAALYLLYQFVGVFGAQTLVGWLEKDLFEAYVNPWFNGLLAQWIPWQVLRDLLGGEFGIFTLGVRYAVALVLPIVGTFFLAFSVIEDSGYLPRLAQLIDRSFKRIGLNGRAVIPLVLGFGCDTMATIVTRTLETRRERIISTMLLSLAIPCSAQLGVMLALLDGRLDLLAIWLGVIGGVFLLVGYLTAQLLPGERPNFYMELPPLRLPRLRNVLVKTYTRMEWYLKEVFPLFIAASVLIWLGQLTGLFEIAVNIFKPIVSWLGLPEPVAQAFLFGFFRRDYGAAGLYDMRALLSPRQLVVAASTMTLFIPCIAQFAVTIKERGWKVALGIAAFILPFAILVGGLLNLILGWLELGA